MGKLLILISIAKRVRRLGSGSLLTISISLAILIVLLLIFVFLIIRRSRVMVEETEEEKAERLEKQRRADSFKRLKSSFKSSLLFLKNKISGEDYRYQLPLFLVLGESLSGRSEILSSLMGTPVKAKKEEKELVEASGAQWWFYDKGAVIEPQGDFILMANVEDLDNDESFIEKGWRKLIKLLKKHRPKRPLDGVVITVSCSDLLMDFGGESEVKDNLKLKADIIYKKLRDLQTRLAFYFPVYALFTKCDQVTGFASFSRQLPESLQDGILGWSNPYSLDASYTSDWVAEGMRYIESCLFEAQLEFFTEKSDVEESEQIFLFPSAFSRLLCPIKLFLDTFFADSAFQRSFFFRGFFFSGSSVDQPEAPSPVFLKDLFDKKIFPERGLGKIIDKTFVSKHRPARLVQLTFVSVLLIGVLGLSNAYLNVLEEKQVSLPVLNLIADSLLELRYKKTVDRSMFEKTGLYLLNGMSEIRPFALTSVFLPSSWPLNLQSRIVSCMTLAYKEIIMRMMFIELNNKARNIGLREEDSDSNEGITKLKDSEELRRLSLFAKSLEDLEKHLAIYNNRLVAGEANSKEFTQVVSYLYGIDLKGTFSSEALSKLRGNPMMTETLQANVNAVIWELAHNFYKRAYKNNILRQKLITLKKLLNNIYTKSFDGLIKSYEELNPDSSMFNDNKTGLGADNNDNIVVRFNYLLRILQNIEKDFANPEYAWIVSDRFELFSELTQTLELVWRSSFLGKEVYKNLVKDGERGLKGLQNELYNQHTRLTGFFLARSSQDASKDSKGLLDLSHEELLKKAKEIRPPADLKENGMKIAKRGLEYGKNTPFLKPPRPSSFQVPVELKYSEKVLALKQALQDFFGMEFTNAEISNSQMLTALPFNKRLIWNTRLLEQAVKLYTPFKVFLDEKLNNFPVELQPIFEQVAREILKTNMMAIIGSSQRQENVLKEINPSFRKKMLRLDVLNFKTASSHVASLLEIFEELEFHEANRKLFRVTATQGNRILREVERLLTEGDFYMVKDSHFEWWNGKEPPALTAYNVNDTDELKFYFSVQQKMVGWLVNDYAVPIVNLLGAENKYRGYIDMSLVDRWERIVAAFKEFEEKKEGNSVEILENFILSGLDEIFQKDCGKEIPGEVLTAKSGDFFLNQRNIIRKRLYQRCQKLSFENDFKAY